MIKLKFIFYFLFISFVLLGCQSDREQKMSDTHLDTTKTTMAETDLINAVCVLQPTEGNKVTGTITFTKVNTGIRVTADIENLSPGSHGFHIHEFGDCSAPDASSAGGHFNPQNLPHGGRTDSLRHVGDFGNVKADSNGKAQTEFIDSHISFSGENSIMGKAIIVHEKADDLNSQPSGDAGSRVACGIIEISE